MLIAYQYQAINYTTLVPLPGASVSIYLTGTTTFAPLYDINGAPISNPMTADPNGIAIFQVQSAFICDLVAESGAYVSPRWLLSEIAAYAEFGAVLTGLQSEVAAIEAGALTGSQAPNVVLASPNGASGPPAMRPLAPADLPAGFLNGLTPLGFWNASTNTPALTSSVGTNATYYIVSVAGSTTLDGNTGWLAGNLAVFLGGVWNKYINTGAVSSVAGRVGAIVLSAADVAGALPGAEVSSISALQALNPNVTTYAIMTQGGRADTFIFNSANLSAQVANDPAHVFYVAPASAPTGASGAWVRQYSGAFNLGWWGFVGDGVTDNSQAMINWIVQCNTLTQSWPFTVTFSQGSGNVAVCNWTNHGLKWNDIISFGGSGTLPTGITAGLLYTVLSTNFTANSFEFAQLFGGPNPNSISQVGNIGQPGNQNMNIGGMSVPGVGFQGAAEGAPIVISNVGSGTLTVTVHNDDWVDLVVPPGNYKFSISDFGSLAQGMKKLRVHAHGAKFYDLGGQIFQTGAYGVLGGQLNSAGDNYGAANCWGYVNTVNQRGGTSFITITLKTTSLAALFYPNQWVLLAALDLQEGTGGPPNQHYFQYMRVSSVNTSTGVLTCFLQNNQALETFLDTFPIWNAGTPGGNALCTGGAAVVYGLPAAWDCEVVWEGLNQYCSEELDAFARKQTYRDCHFLGQGFVPTQAQSIRFERCSFGNGGSQVAGAGAIDLGGYTFVQDAQFDKLVEQIVDVDGVWDHVTISGSSIKDMTFERSRIGSLQGMGRRNRFIGCTVPTMLFGTGGGCMDNCEIIDTEVSSSFLPYTEGELFNAYIPQLWTFSSGTLKMGLAPWLNITGKEFSVKAVPGSKWYMAPFGSPNTNLGSPFTILNVYTDGSSNFSVDTDLTALPVGQSTSSAVTITNGTPSTVNWTAHGLTAGTPFLFYASAGATLQTGMSVFTLYYVLAAGLTTNAFEFATSPGGTAIATTGSLTGTLSAVANPLVMVQHPAPRLTVRGCTGVQSLTDQNGIVDKPAYSQIKRSFVLPGINDGAIGPVWGNLVSMSIKVVRASAAAATLVISGTGYTSALAASAWTETVDCTVVGTRTITPNGVTFTALNGVTGSVPGTDTLSAITNWLGSLLTAQSTGSFGTLSNSAVVELLIETDQGITAYHNLESAWLNGSTSFGNQTYTDSVVGSAFTT